MRSCHQKKVVVAMSGGVDSSVTAALLLEEGCEVEGVSLRLWEHRSEGPRNCSDHRGAQAVAKVLGIRHTLLDLRSEFYEAVVGPFARTYLAGRTPNPCIACNRDFKLGALVEWAKERADYVATGHYARLTRDPFTGRTSLARGVDSGKDQSYFLFALSQEQLAHALFPLGEWRKEEVRAKASRLGLPVARRPESQDICFGDYAALVESFAGEGEIGDVEIVDRSGARLGRRRGLHSLTIGQRRGLGVAASHPLYVLEIDAERGRVVVGTKEELGCNRFRVRPVNWIEPPREDELFAGVQVRYRSAPVPCWIRVLETECAVSLQETFPPVTPGQAAVFYDGDRVLGGGWITQAIRDERIA